MDYPINNIFEYSPTPSPNISHNIFEATTHVEDGINIFERTEAVDNIFERTNDDLRNDNELAKMRKIFHVRHVDVHERVDFIPIIVISSFFLFFILITPCVAKGENKE